MQRIQILNKRICSELFLLFVVLFLQEGFEGPESKRHMLSLVAVGAEEFQESWISSVLQKNNPE